MDLLFESFGRHAMEFIGLLVVVFGLLFWMVRMKPGGESPEAAIAKHAAQLTHRYKNALGIDTEGGRVYAMGHMLDKADIRAVEASSILETRIGGWGHQFHKDKHCKLTIHTNSLDVPLIAVPFDVKKEMDEWRSRLAVFCGLS